MYVLFASSGQSTAVHANQQRFPFRFETTKFIANQSAGHHIESGRFWVYALAALSKIFKVKIILTCRFAKHIGLGEQQTDIRGSPLYMAPEILLERRYDPSADLWSIGCILYECLFGAAPYRSVSMDELLNKIKTKAKICIPPTKSEAVKISAVCSDILRRLLVHEPKNRISFDEFFAHPFLDLQQPDAVDDHKLRTAIDLFTQAVQLDNRERFGEAYKLYCEGLQHFVDVIGAERDETKRERLRDKANVYMKRAEEIKGICGAEPAVVVVSDDDDAKKVSRQNSTTNERPLNRPVTVRNHTTVLTPSVLYTKLREAHLEYCNVIFINTIWFFSPSDSMCSSSPNIQSALEIGRVAELFLSENNLDAATNSFRTALGLLVPLLQEEPAGHRRDMLHKQVFPLAVCSGKDDNVFKKYIYFYFLDKSMDERS